MLYPLYTDDDAVVEPALEGTWVDANKPDDCPILLEKSGAHQYTMTICDPGTKFVQKIDVSDPGTKFVQKIDVSDPGTKFVQNYDVNLVRLGNQLYMDIAFSEQTIDGTKLDFLLGAFSAHEIVKLNSSGRRPRLCAAGQRADSRSRTSGTVNRSRLSTAIRRR